MTSAAIPGGVVAAIHRADDAANGGLPVRCQRAHQHDDLGRGVWAHDVRNGDVWGGRGDAVAELWRGHRNADVQQPAATDESIAIRVHEYDVQLSGDGEQRADRGVGGLGGWGDDVVQLRWGEPADRGVEQFVVGDVWVRRVWESDVEERDGRGALDDGVVRRGEPSGGEQLRREWESVVWGEHEQLVQCGESDGGSGVSDVAGGADGVCV